MLWAKSQAGPIHSLWALSVWDFSYFIFFFLAHHYRGFNYLHEHRGSLHTSTLGHYSSQCIFERERKRGLCFWFFPKAVIFLMEAWSNFSILNPPLISQLKHELFSECPYANDREFRVWKSGLLALLCGVFLWEGQAGRKTAELGLGPFAPDLEDLGKNIGQDTCRWRANQICGFCFLWCS